jgi:hypothetical protein
LLNPENIRPKTPAKMGPRELKDFFTKNSEGQPKNQILSTLFGMMYKVNKSKNFPASQFSHLQTFEHFYQFVVSCKGKIKTIRKTFWGSHLATSAEIEALKDSLPKFLKEKFLSSGSEISFLKDSLFGSLLQRLINPKLNTLLIYETVFKASSITDLENISDFSSVILMFNSSIKLFSIKHLNKS